MTEILDSESLFAAARERTGHDDFGDDDLPVRVESLFRQLDGHLDSQAAQAMRMESLRTLLGLDSVPQRIECFDISHTMGEATVASCVVFGPEGAIRGQYRRFNISGITPGDDFAAMHQALERRFRRAVEEDGVLPDLLLIDGGAGQVAQANAVLGDLAVFCGEQQSSVRVNGQKVVDPYAMAIAEGRREVWLRIRAMLEMDSSEAWTLAQRERAQAAAARQGGR